MLEHGDLLLRTVVVDAEIVLVERADETTGGVLDCDQKPYKPDVHANYGLLLCAHGGKQQLSGDEDSPARAFHRFRTDSSHSPSTQTSPSAKYSFFQIGTRRLSRLIPSSAGSNAGLRCGAVTITATLVSPMFMRPRRWTIAMRPTGNCSAISRPMPAMTWTAIGS